MEIIFKQNGFKIQETKKNEREARVFRRFVRCRFLCRASVDSYVSSIKVGFVFGYAVDMGVFLYPLTFTLRDLVHRELGRKMTRKCIYFAVLLFRFYRAVSLRSVLARFGRVQRLSGAGVAHCRVFPVGATGQRIGRYGSLPRL